MLQCFSKAFTHPFMYFFPLRKGVVTKLRLTSDLLCILGQLLPWDPPTSASQMPHSRLLIKPNTM